MGERRIHEAAEGGFPDDEPPSSDLAERAKQLIVSDGFDDDLAEIEFVLQGGNTEQYLDSVIKESILARRLSVAVLALELKRQELAKDGFAAVVAPEIKNKAKELEERAISASQLGPAGLARELIKRTDDPRP